VHGVRVAFGPLYDIPSETMEEREIEREREEERERERERER
jgi:hypothetical protein